MILKEGDAATDSNTKLYIIKSGLCEVVKINKDTLEDDVDHIPIPVTVAAMKVASKPTPLQTQRCEANFSDKHNSNAITLSDLTEGQYFGDPYLYNNDTHFK